MSNQSIFSQIKSKVDFIDIFEFYGIELLSNNTFHCPFHDDDHPSANIFADNQMFKCFACDIHGDIIEFVSLYEKISKLEAVKFIAENFNIEINDEELKKYKAIELIIESASNSITDEMLKNISNHYSIPIDILKKFKIGYYINPIKKELEDLIGGYSFRNRIIFGYDNKFLIARYYPLYEQNKKNGKYKKPKGMKDRFYLDWTIKDNKYIFLVEGPTDALSIYPILPENSAILAIGAANLSRSHLNYLSKLKDKIFIILPDNDEPGLNGAKNSLEKMKKLNLDAYLPENNIIYPLGYDPNEALKNGYITTEYLKSLIKEANRIVEERKKKEELIENSHLFDNYYIDFEKNYIYFYKKRKDYEEFKKVSNFIFLFKSVYIKDENETDSLKYEVEIITEKNRRKIIEINSKNLFSYERFIQIIGSKFMFLFLDIKYKFKELISRMLSISNPNRIYIIDKLGQYKNIFVATNAIIKDGIIYKEDENNIIKINNKLYKINPPKEIKIELHPEDKIKNIIVDFYKFYEEAGIIGITWLAGSLLKDKMTKILKGYPILNFSGEPGAGKTSYIKHLCNIAGFKEPSKMASTLSSIKRNISKYSNYPLFYDEYSLKDDFKKELLKAVYDNSFFDISKKHTDDETVQFYFRAALAISGEHTFGDTALSQRSLEVSVRNMEDEYSIREQIFNNKYENIKTSYLFYIAQTIGRLDIDKIFQDIIDKYKSDIKKYRLSDRQTNKYLTLLVSYKILSYSIFELPLSEEEFYQLIIEKYLEPSKETDRDDDGEDLLEDFLRRAILFFRDNKNFNINEYMYVNTRGTLIIDIKNLYLLLEMKKIPLQASYKTIRQRLKKIGKILVYNKKKVIQIRYEDVEKTNLINIYNQLINNNNNSCDDDIDELEF